MEKQIHIPQMETIAKTAEIFGLPEHFVRKLVLCRMVVFVKAGKKYLVNIEKFADFLNGATADETSEEENEGRIPPIPLKF